MLSEKLVKIQSELVVPKSRHNSFGNYSYRSLEDILEAVKPLLSREGLVLTLSDTIELIGDYHYVKATARLTDGSHELIATAYAREAVERKGMDVAQITGASSSYARKYCLNALFLIDDTQDPDTEEYTKMKQEHQNKAVTPDSNKKWLQEVGNGKQSTTPEEFNKVEEAVKSGKIKPSELRKHYKVGRDTMKYFETLV